jgi:hypothetical protein
MKTLLDEPVPSTGTVASAQVRLAHDPAGALADAETALAHGGGADAFAARADAELALGRPLDQVIADYGKAAKLNPDYLERYQGLVVQRYTESHPQSRRKTGGVSLGADMTNDIALMLAGGAIGFMILIIMLVMIKGRDTSAECRREDDERRRRPS